MINSLPKSQKKSPNKSKATMRDVANDAGVSVAVVSCYLNGKRSYSSKTEQRITQVVSDLNYTLRKPGRPRVTKAPPKHVPKAIALLFPEPFDCFVKTRVNKLVCNGIRKVCTLLDIELVRKHITDEQSLNNAIRGNQINCVIFIGDPDVSVFKRCLNGLPAVRVLGEPEEYAWWDHVIYDNSVIGQMAAQYFLKNKHSICACYAPEEPCIPDQTDQVLTTSSNAQTNKYRINQFVQTIQKAGGTVQVGAHPRTVKGKLTSSTIKILRGIMLGKLRPTCLYMPTNYGAVPVCRVLKQLGRLPLRKNSWLITNTWPLVSQARTRYPLCINIQPEILGDQAVRLVIDQFENPTPDNVLLTLYPIAP